MSYLILINYSLITFPFLISCTIDINLSELEYIASHLDLFECRRLIAALHYSSHNLPKNLSGAGIHIYLSKEKKIYQHFKHF